MPKPYSDKTPERQRVLDYLAQFGLDASEIKADDWDADGFTLVRSKETRHPWPEGFNYSWFAVAMNVAYLADMRRAGIRV